MKTLASLAAGTCVLLSGTAYAADIPLKAPVKPVWTDSWAGYYFGVYFGAGAGRTREAFTDVGADSSRSVAGATTVVSTFDFRALGNPSGDVTGSMVELFAGHNWRIGNFVVGGQVEGTVFSDVSLKATGIGNSVSRSVQASTVGGVTTTTSSTFANSFTTERYDQLRSNVGVIGRVGYLVAPDVLIYGLGGLALGNFVYPDGGDFEGGRNSKWVAGYTAGAGGEYRVDEHWSLRAEYRYLHFDVKRGQTTNRSTTEVTTSTFTSTDATSVTRHADVDLHVGKVGLVYRFAPNGSPRAAMAAIPSALATADSWAGLYYGIYFGAGSGRATDRETASATGTGAFTALNGDTARETFVQSRVGGGTGDMTGSTVDLFAGYNWRFGSVVAGGQVEGTLFSDVTLKTIGRADITSTTSSASTIGGVTTTNSLSSTNAGTVEFNQQLRSNVGAIARLGVLVTPDILLYGLGGLALGHFVYPDAFGDDSVPGKNGKWVAGYTAGAGGEFKLNDNWSLRAEYRYLHFDFGRNEERNQTAFQQSATGVANSAETQISTRSIGADFHMGKVGVVYKFGGGGTPLSAMAAIPASVEPADSWAGFYFGVYFGAGAGRAGESFTGVSASDSRTVSPGNISTSASRSSNFGDIAGDMTGSTVDLFVGRNWRFGSFVAGGQVEGTVFSDVALKTIGPSYGISSSLDQTNGVTTSASSGSSVGQESRNDQLRSNFAVIGRAGFLVTPDVLLYGLGGLSLGHFVYPDGRDAYGGKNGKWVAGYTAGAGGEVKLNDNWSLRAEYRYQHFDFDRSESQSGASTGTFLTTTLVSSSNQSTDRNTRAEFHSGKVGVVYKFGPAEGARSALAAMPTKALAASDGWTGLYWGAYFGAGVGEADGSITQTSSTATRAVAGNGVTTQTASNSARSSDVTGDVTGSTVDLFVGQNWRFGSFVAGGQVEGTLFSDVSLKTSGYGTNTSRSTSTSGAGVVTVTSTNTTVLLDEHRDQLRSNLGVIARAGFLVTPDVLLYGLGGLALGHFVYPDNTDPFVGKTSKWVAGYTAGAGGEVKLNANWSLRAEYRYLHFDVERDEAVETSSTSLSGTTRSFNASSSSISRQTDAQFHTGKVGVVYKFSAR